MAQQLLNTDALSEELIKSQLWRRGNLSWLLDDNQKALYELFHKKDHKIQTWLLARRSGKSFALCVMAIEQCLRHPGSIIKFLSPTKKQVERNIRPLMRQILETCPSDISPDLKQKDDIYYFPNGSEIQMAGSESGNIESLRGGFSHICIIDEAQDVSDLQDAINSVLLPTTLTTKGKILLAGTPPKNYDHDFLLYVEGGERDGSLVKRTVYDNPRLTKYDIETQANAMGGYDSEDFRREFLCELIKDSSKSVVPEFDQTKAAILVRDWVKPDFYTPYVSMDLGFRDWTVVVFAYYDFVNDKLIIEDEIVTHGSKMHLHQLGWDIYNKEGQLWKETYSSDRIKPAKRVSDNDLIALNEINKATNYLVRFETARKDDMLSGINFLRTMINADKIIINPKCKTVVDHLLNGRWTSNSKDKLARCSNGSHYDAIPTLSYLLRAVDFKKNPYPRDYKKEVRPADGFYTQRYGKETIEHENVYRKILNLKGSK